MHVSSPQFENGQPIPDEFAFAKPAAEGHVTLSLNRNPALEWSNAPEGTQSFVITCIDDDAPTRPDDVNLEGREVPEDLARAEFVHWLLADLPADQQGVSAGDWCDGVTARGKSSPPAPIPAVQGQNDYTGWFQGDPEMDGAYNGYDGPCPPWNDARVHRYRFCVMALSVPTLGLQPGFTLTDLRKAIEGKVLDSAQITGTYTLNPRLRPAD